MQVNYSVKGEGQKQIILLHGWGGSINSLQGIQDLLAGQQFKVFNMDLPGFGQSAQLSAAMTLDDYVEYLKRFITELKIEKPILIGHSFGGKTAMAFAVKYPQYVSKLVLINASGLNPQNDVKKNTFALTTKIGGLLFSLPILGKFKDVVRKVYYKLFVGESDYLNAGPMRDTFKNIVSEHLDALIPKISKPTLVVWGARDTATPLWQGEKLAQLIPHARLETVADATHGLPLKQPQLVVQLIQSFIAS